MYAIIDCNSFYCSCERLFRPELDEKPVVVLSNNDGCIVSRSDEAKDLGIKMATPYFMAKEIIEKNDVAAFSSNYNLYGDMSRRVMDTLRILLGKDNVEVYSVDEAFLNLHGLHEKDLQKAGIQIKETVEQWTGIKVSIGIAPTKVLCKVANHIAKADKKGTAGVVVLNTAEQIKETLNNTPVKELWGIGKKYGEKLTEMHAIFTAGDLSRKAPEWMYRHMGGVVGVRLLSELNCVPAITMKEELVIKKMIATTRMFGHTVSDVNAIKEAVATYASAAAEKLRRQGGAAGVVSVFIVAKGENHNVDFRGSTHSLYTTLPYATSATNELIKAAVKLAERLFTKGFKYKKAGVILSGIVPDETIQANLFVPEQHNGKRMLMSMLDNINFSMRNDIVKFAASGITRNWKMRMEHRSPRYTSRWEELFEIKN